MQFSNMLLVMLCLAAVVLNPLSERIGAFIAGLFVRLERLRHRTSIAPSRPSLGHM